MVGTYDVIHVNVVVSTFPGRESPITARNTSKHIYWYSILLGWIKRAARSILAI